MIVYSAGSGGGTGAGGSCSAPRLLMNLVRAVLHKAADAAECEAVGSAECEAVGAAECEAVCSTDCEAAEAAEHEAAGAAKCEICSIEISSAMENLVTIRLSVIRIRCKSNVDSDDWQRKVMMRNAKYKFV